MWCPEARLEDEHPADKSVEGVKEGKGRELFFKKHYWRRYHDDDYGGYHHKVSE